jgi:hypothetical protein
VRSAGSRGLRMGDVDESVQRPLDVVIGASSLLVEKAGAARRRAAPVLGPLGRAFLRPPLVPLELQPAQWLSSLAGRGGRDRVALLRELSALLDIVVPTVIADVLRRAQLTEKLIRYVDLDAVVASVDLDAAAARLDVDAVVRRADLDAAAARLDVDAVVRRADLDGAVSRVDVDVIAQRLDLDAVLDRLDLTAVVLQRVDLEAVVAAVLDRVDLVGLAEEIVDEIDLPEIIRESSGSMASDTVRGARMQGIAADEAVGRAVDRLLLRRTPRG